MIYIIEIKQHIIRVAFLIIKKGTRKIAPRMNILILNLLIYNFVFVIKLKVVALSNILSKKTLHFVLIEINTAIIAELLVSYIVRAHFAAVSHCSYPPRKRSYTYYMKRERSFQAVQKLLPAYLLRNKDACNRLS